MILKLKTKGQGDLRDALFYDFSLLVLKLLTFKGEFYRIVIVLAFICAICNVIS